MRRILFIAGILLINLNVFSQYDPDALEILNSMSAKYREIGAFKASFTQEMVNESVDLKEKIKGDIIVEGDKYYLEIAGQEIYNDGENLWNYSPDIKEVTITPYIPEEQEISLSNIYDIYQNGFKYILLGLTDDGDKIIDLDPESREKSYYKIRMIINDQNELKKFTVFERKGNKYIYTINKFEELSRVPNSQFRFDTDKNSNVEVIDFR